MTQLSLAREGIITEAMRKVAEDEGLSPEEIRDKVSAGRVVIPLNVKRKFSPKGIGEGLSTKVNANIGTSGHHADLNEEMDKLHIAVASGADSVMDLSTGGDLSQIRKAIIDECQVMIGTVPIYGLAAQLDCEDREIVSMEVDELFDHIEQHCEDGVDFITVHCGVTQEAMSKLKKTGRIGGIVSRGGSLLAAWMKHNQRENPLYEQFDRLLEITFKYDVTLSLGDGLRPGAIADATDPAQLEELTTLGELFRRARNFGVQTMIEGPGHVPLRQVEANVLLAKTLCDGAPLYVLGPLTTDVAPGYDHITGAIGGAIAAAAGADFLCYVTPAEHLRLPTVRDVREGVIATRIAAHTGDLAKGVKGAMDWDNRMSAHRKKLDWEGMYSEAIDPHLARSMRKESENYDEIVCTMCGKLCSIKLTNEYL
ncbi:phosphomethylpyrimidine synthase ThiC [bacterium]|nr:phosphomethylpyrimidine synthase ThiC [bacterium]